jgi:hypothetical protein
MVEVIELLSSSDDELEIIEPPVRHLPNWAQLPLQYPGVLQRVMELALAQCGRSQLGPDGWDRSTSAAVRLTCFDWREAHDACLPRLQINFVRDGYHAHDEPQRLPPMWGWTVARRFTHLKRLGPVSEGLLRPWSRGEGYSDGEEAVDSDKPHQHRLANAIKPQDEQLFALCTITSLSDLDVRECQELSSVGLNAIRSLPNLTRLSLRECGPKVTSRDLVSALRGCTKLTQLEYSETLGRGRLNDDGVTELCRVLTALQSLQLLRCPEVGDRGLNAIGDLPNLQRLHLTSGGSDYDFNPFGPPQQQPLRRVTEAGVRGLATLTGLTHLALVDCEALTAAAFRLLRCHTGLQRLDLEAMGVGMMGGEMGVAEARELSNLTSLKWLSLMGRGVTREAIGELCNLTNLTFLNLSESCATEVEVRQLATRLTALKSLELYGDRMEGQIDYDAIGGGAATPAPALLPCLSAPPPPAVPPAQQ